MTYKTYYENDKKIVAGCIEMEIDGEIKSGHNACNCTCNCFCSCACFKILDKDDSLITTNEEYLEKMLHA